MPRNNRWIWIASIALMVIGAASLILNLVPGWNLDISWPVLMIVLGCGIGLAVQALAGDHPWWAYLYIPAAIFVSLGFVFLLNVITGDWNAWAYAWMLVLAGTAAGVYLTAQKARLPSLVSSIALITAAAGAVLSVPFGALVGGKFMQIMAPALLVIAGVVLYRVYLRPGRAGQEGAAEKQPARVPDQAGLMEPLSPRELEVLTLIDEGLTNAEIAQELTLASSTVKTHINNIYGKLGVESRTQALKTAREKGLLRSGV